MIAFGTLASTPPQSVEAPASTSRLHRRLAVCLVYTGLNATVIGTFAGTLYRATADSTLQRAGVNLLFAALLGSLARMWLFAQRSRAQ